MNLKIQKRLAAQVLGCSQSKIIFDNERLGDIKESITKIDIKNLVKEKAIAKKLENGPSRVRARKIATQKRKDEEPVLVPGKAKRPHVLIPRKTGSTGSESLEAYSKSCVRKKC